MFLVHISSQGCAEHIWKCRFNSDKQMTNEVIWMECGNGEIMTYSLSPISLLHESYFDARHKMGTEEKMPRHRMNPSTHWSATHEKHLVKNQQTSAGLNVNYTSFDVASCFCACHFDSCMQQMEMKCDFALKLIKENRTSATGVYTAVVSLVNEKRISF